MSVFVILGLLVCIEAQGPSAVTTVFVQKGDDLILNVDDVPEDFSFVEWKFNKTVGVVRFAPGGRRSVLPDFTGRIEFPVKKFSVKLKNLQEADSGVYTAQVSTLQEGVQPLAEYKVTVQGPVSPVELTVDSVDSVDSVVSRGSDSCNLTVTCSTQHSHISSTFRCVSRTCSQEGGEQPELTTSGASLHVYLLNSSIICNHSNQVTWTEDFKRIEPFCPQYAGSEGSSAGTSVYLVKMVVFSVGLIIMVSAVITVHLMEKFKKHK
ncbi:SLAM family member 9-like [Anarhichas minor]|uniref:SLAM family member 9-like n=1 Tax=Anarhichas minor TaxID=65739 RepID=UPI003F733A90